MMILISIGVFLLKTIGIVMAVTFASAAVCWLIVDIVERD